MIIGKIIRMWRYCLVLPHIIVYNMISLNKRELIIQDVKEMNEQCSLNCSLGYYLVFKTPYRNVFYHRVGRISHILKMLLPEYSSFYISDYSELGGGCFVLNHPFSTIINAKKIGKNFTICQLTTIGNAWHGRNDLIPEIGDNVSLGANVSIIGGIKIGNNVIVGAGSVVVKDVPDNCIIAGNPARVLKKIQDCDKDKFRTTAHFENQK